MVDELDASMMYMHENLMDDDFMCIYIYVYVYILVYVLVCMPKC
jgi:hypothetical protein